MPTSSTVPLSPRKSCNALVVAFADPALLVEVLDEIENRALVLGGLLRRAAGLDVADRLRLHAGLLGDRRMGVPFRTGRATSGRAQDREFRLAAGSQRGLEAHEGAELLGQLAVLGRMHVDAERAAELDPCAARARAHGFEQRTLGVVELVFGQLKAGGSSASCWIFWRP